MADYSILLTDQFGDPLDEIDDFLTLSYNLVVDAVGGLAMVLPPDYPLADLRWDGRILVYRNGLLEGEAPWFIREVEPSTMADGTKMITCTAYAGNYVLSGRVVAYQPGTSQADKNDKADSLMVAVVNENFGSVATDTNRDLSSYMSIQASASLGPTIQKEMAWNNVLDVLQEVAKTSANQGSPVHFDVVAPTRSTIEFRTYRGQRGTDHTAASGVSEIILSLERENLGSPARRNFDRSGEVTFAYAAGQGATSASTESASDGGRIGISPFNRREVFVQAGGTSASAGLADEARTAVRVGRPKRVFEAVVLDVPGIQYGVHWRFGDKVTAEYGGETFDVSVDAITVHVSGGEETITARLRAED